MILIVNEPFNRRERVKILSRPDSILQVIEGMKPPKSIPKNMAAVVATSTMLASAKTIEANAGAAAELAIEAITTGSRHSWQPNDISASVDDVVEWKLGLGTHGVRITNWAAVRTTWKWRRSPASSHSMRQQVGATLGPAQPVECSCG